VIARLTSPELKEVYNITFSGDGRRLAASSEAGAVVWDINSQAEISSLPAKPIRNALALNGDGRLLALGCWDGVELWTLPAKDAVRRFAEGVQVESVLFAHQDEWIVALTASALPPQPKQRLQEYRREIAVWDSASGNKLKTFKTDALDELRFGLTSGGPYLLLATDFKDHLRAWSLDSGELKATWETSSGHPSADGKFLLREGGALGQLELWEISSPDEKARPFAYKSPLCAKSFADDKGTIKFEGLSIADGVSDEDEPLGSYSGHNYVAQDCTPLNVTRLSYKTAGRARQELDREVAQTIEVLEKGLPKDASWQGVLGERRVLRFPRRGPTPGPFAVIWLQGNSIIEINSPALPVALAGEKQFLEKW
jgi:WD40 repeat protein